MSAAPVLQGVDWHPGFLAVLPVLETHARIQLRHLKPERRNEAIAEAIASACASYRLLAHRNRLHLAHPSTIADFAVRFVRNGRHVGGRQNSARDVLSPVAQKRHGLKVQSLQDLPKQADTDDWKSLAIAQRNQSVPDVVAFRLDFSRWLRRQSRRNHRLIRGLIRGERPSVLAEQMGLSAGRVSQLRRQFQRDWLRFQGEPDVQHAA